MSNSLWFRASLIACALIGLSSAIVQAQEKIRIRPNTPAGTAWTFHQIEEMTLDTTVKVAGQEQTLQQKVARKIAGSAEVLEADTNGKPTAIKFVFDADCGGQMTQMGQQMPIPFALAGKTVTGRMTNGQFTHDLGAQLEKEAELELKGMMADDEFLPTDPVGVGDRWSPDAKKLAERWQLDAASSKIAVALTLKQFGEVAGRKVAIVDLAGDVSGQMEGLTGQRTIAGTAAIDLQTGRILSGDLGGTLTLGGLQQQPGEGGQVMVMDLKSNGTMKVKSQVNLKSRGAGPVAGPINPIGGPGPAPQIRGKYIGDKIALNFNQGTVEILSGTQTYTGAISRFDGQNFAGRFRTPDGGEFDFSGTVNGPDMTFKTGSAEYRLKGEAQRNPLAP